MYPQGPTSKAQVKSTEYDAQEISVTDLGSVHLHGPFGNTTSKVKIAYLIGMHPLESKSHRALFDKLTNKDNLNYCYYIYNIDVSPESESEGRLEGQTLAKDFVLPHILNEKYDLFVDIHSNRGNNGPGGYEITNFVFMPGFDTLSSKFINEIIKNIDEISFYIPEFRTSPPFITEPSAKAGIATIVYECFTYESMETTYNLAEKLIKCIDNITFF